MKKNCIPHNPKRQPAPTVRIVTPALQKQAGALRQERAATAAAALRTSEKQFRSMFEKHSAIMLLLEPSTGRILNANLAAVAFYGYSRKKFQSMSIDQITRLPSAQIAEARQQAEVYREMGLEVLKILNVTGDVPDFIQCVLAVLKARTGFAAVGIRLQEGEDFPYFVQDGFPQDFLRTENTLIAREREGGVCREKDGKVALECTCGLVLSGQTDPAHPFFTAGGSFWTNDSFPMLDIPPGQDLRLHPRNQCIHHGYASVALVPIRSQEQIMGLIQFNDRRKDCFNRETVELLEGIAAHIGMALRRKRDEQALQESNRQLQEKMDALAQTQRQLVQQASLQALGQMASGLAHDFNNALAPIVGFSELLLKHPAKLADRETATRFLQSISTCARDAADMVRRMREFGRQRTAEKILEGLDLPGVIHQTLELTRPRWEDQAQANGLTIQMVTDLRKVPPLAGEEFAIRELLTNLIFNAVDAMPSGGTITLGTAVEGTFVRLWISDTGTGMTEEVRQRCFEPFFTTKADNGTGLGLAMVHGIVQRHGGTVEVASAVGQGTTFTIWLPLQPTKLVAGLTAATALDRKLHVLLVDDEPLLRDIAEAWLTADGHTVALAASGAAALTQLKSGRFDLVITDKAMPSMNGEQLASAIQANTPGLPVILMSGFGDLMKVAGELPPHISVILSKPITQTSMREALAKVFLLN